RDGAALDAVSGKQLAVLRGHKNVVVAVVYSPDGGRLATASTDGTARLWGAASREPLGGLEGHTAPLDAVALSPNRRRRAPRRPPHPAAGTAAVGAPPPGTHPPALRGHPPPVAAGPFTPAGPRPARGSYDGTARLWAREPHKELRRFEGHPAGVAFSPDGGRL